MGKIKDIFICNHVLKNFDSKIEIVIQTDAPQDGLGCCLLQNNLPVAYASRSLIDAEKRYAPIEKEFMSFVFACQKFHHYIYGRTVKVKNDQKPLESIMKKDIHKIMTPRLQRI